MIAKVVICDCCGAWYRGSRKESPIGWRTKKSKDICPKCPDPAEWHKHESTSERNRQIFTLRTAGTTYRQIGQKYGISVARVREIHHVEERRRERVIAKIGGH